MAPLVFVVPVRHQDSVPDWAELKGYMAQTLASIAAQTVPDWACIVVANEGADLPDLPTGCRACFVDLPLPNLPDRDADREAFYDAIRADKGLRVHAGLRDVDGDSHVMIVDFDDFVSRRLAEYVAARRAAPGWNVERGYLWSGGGWAYLKTDFHAMCGTSHIVRRDLYGDFERAGRIDMEAVKRRLGSHIFIHHDLAAASTPLAALPFPGAVYRVGTAQSTSGNGSIFGLMTPPRRLLRHPVNSLRRLRAYRRLDAGLRREFTIPKT